jgi:hypothetical protein
VSNGRDAKRQGEVPQLGRQLAWLAVIWLAGVLALASVVLVLRIAMRWAGL